jgi:hypothetical protein
MFERGEVDTIFYDVWQMRAVAKNGFLNGVDYSEVGFVDLEPLDAAIAFPEAKVRVGSGGQRVALFLIIIVLEVSLNITPSAQKGSLKTNRFFSSRPLIRGGYSISGISATNQGPREKCRLVFS